MAGADPAADGALVEALADWCGRYTPLVGLDGPDGLLLDIGGCAHLFGGEAALRADLLARLGGFGLAARGAVAGTPEAARALAHFGEGGVVAPGGEAEAVRALPVEALALPEATFTALAHAGLKRIGDLAERPRAPLIARFGAELAARLDGVLGRAWAPISPRRPVAALIAERRFAEPLVREEDIRVCLGHLAREIAAALERKGQGGRRFEASFFRSDGTLRRIAVATACPVCDPAALVRLFDERLAALCDPLDAGFGFDVIRLAVAAGEPLEARQAAFGGGETARREIAGLVDRLSARLGPGRVRRFEAGDSHIPERASAAVPALADARVAPAWRVPEASEPLDHDDFGSKRSTFPDPALARPLCLFDPPQPVETLAEVPDGPPLRFRWRRVVHEVTRAEGPERIAAEWWREGEGPTRDYYRVEDARGGRFWLFREGLYGRETAAPRWFLHGLFP